MPEKSTILETSISSSTSSTTTTARNVPAIYKSKSLLDDNQNVNYLVLLHIMHMYLC